MHEEEDSALSAFSSIGNHAESIPAVALCRELRPLTGFHAKGESTINGMV
jgi:hypothetical protein